MLTTVAGVRCSAVSVCDSVCVSVCPPDKTKLAKTTTTKLATVTVHHQSSPQCNIRSKIRSKVKGHSVKSAKTY